jgi:co-chaperonin GroES (HSP10)
MAINIVSNTVSRADEGDATDATGGTDATETTTSGTTSNFGHGTEDEYAVIDAASVIFYFYDEEGKPFAVDGDKNYVTGSDIKNVENAQTENVSAAKLLVVLSSKEGDTPASVVAVVNKDYTETGTKVSLADVKAKTAAYAGKNAENDGKYFVMASSAYQDANGTVTYAAPIPANSLALTADLAAANPVNIHVERVVAKTSIADIRTTTTVTPLQATTSEEGSATEAVTTYANGSALPTLTAVVKGYKLFNTATSTTLIKNIDGYTESWAWNDAANFRSYWAVSPTNLAIDNSTLSWDNMAGGDAIQYPFENTLADATDVDNHTNIAVAVQLQDADGKGITLAKWLSKYYTLDDLKTAVANYLANTLYSYADGKWTSITPKDIDFTTEDAKHSYQVRPTVTGTWYKKGETTALTADEVKAILVNVPNAQIWNDGMCYYYTPIVHAIGDFSAKAIVRNHWYQINISSITGLGTPVYDKDEAVDPTKPDDQTQDEWYLDAQINILSWRIIAQKVDLE